MAACRRMQLQSVIDLGCCAFSFCGSPSPLEAATCRTNIYLLLTFIAAQTMLRLSDSTRSVQRTDGRAAKPLLLDLKKGHISTHTSAQRIASSCATLEMVLLK